MRRIKGLTLIELLITIAITAIVVGLAVPNMTSFFDGKELIGAAEQIAGHMEQARTESLARSQDIHLKVDSDGSSTWVYGLSLASNPSCDLTLTDPTTAGACVLVADDGDNVLDSGDGSTDTGDLLLMRFPSTTHDDIKLTLASGASNITFEYIRGTSSESSLELESPEGKKLRVKLNLMGQVRLCSPDGSVNGYSTTDC